MTINNLLEQLAVVKKRKEHAEKMVKWAALNQNRKPKFYEEWNLENLRLQTEYAKLLRRIKFFGKTGNYFSVCHFRRNTKSRAKTLISLY